MATQRADSSDYDAANAGADLSAKLHYLAHMDTDGDLVLAGSGEPVYGVITEPAVENKSVTVQVSGVAKVIIGATLTPGERVMADGNGKAIPATATKNSVGICRKGGAANVIGEIQIDRTFVET